jgi:N-acetyl-alpha-D-glucosaminyl L-malate synthase BshA
LLHVHYAIPHAYAGYMAKQMLKEKGVNLPMITTLHGTDITLVGNHPHYKPAVTFSINNSDEVTSVSQNLKDTTNKIFSITKDIKVIPNFIEIEKSKVDTSEICYRSIMAKADEKIITHISNFRKVKRIPDVIEIFFQIQQKIPAKLMMVGDGPEKEKAEYLCEKLGISEQVIFFGNSHEITKILCLSDLFLLPSETESFGLAALEAMACSVPVISTNTGGLPEVNIDNYSGFTFNVSEINQMAESAINLLNNNDLLAQFKKQAFEVANRFDIVNIMPIYEDLYKKTLERYV